MVMLFTFYFELQALMRQRSAYQRFARVIRPIAVVVMRGPSQIVSPNDMSRVNEKQEALLKRSNHWWRTYRSFKRALCLLSRAYSWSAIGS